jgi:hypothetical protein
MNTQGISQILQISIAPCVLISGFGLLLLSLTNRFARPIDRIRQLVKEEKEASLKDKPAIQKQIQIFYRRSLLLRKSIGCIVTSIILASLIMLLLFSNYLLKTIFVIILIKLFFATSLIFLIVGLTFFLMDIRLTLRSIEIEATAYLKH